MSWLKVATTLLTFIFVRKYSLSYSSQTGIEGSMRQKGTEGALGSPADGGQQKTIEEGDHQLAEGHPLPIHQRLDDVSDVPHGEQKGIQQNNLIGFNMDAFLQIE